MLGNSIDIGGGFFLWLAVDDDVAFAKRAYQEQGLRIMPGRFMSVTTDDGNPGAGYVRVALVHPLIRFTRR